MNVSIHSTAVVHPDAKIGEGTTIGAFTVVESNVTIGKGAKVGSHVVIQSHTHIGDRAKIHPFVVLGGAPQHLKYADEPTTLEIGNDVTIREAVTCHRGTVMGGGRTVIKDRVYLMAYCHVAHDCIIGNDCILANNAGLSGHVEVGDFVTIGGMVGVTQFCRIGAYCFIGGSSVIRRDLPPFLTGKGEDFEVQGINLVGLQRRGFSRETLRTLKNVYKIFYLQNLTISQAIEKTIVEYGNEGEVGQFLKFLENSKNGITR